MPFRGWLTLTLTAVLFASGPPASAQPRRPVYVGAKICATCHDGENMGHQTTLWLYSRHANAYASLATPEARAIAAISGVPIEPHRSPLCLGCHATAAEAEGWEKDETFSIRDGVQCEKCHGPGSEHVDSWSAPNDPKSGPKCRLPQQSAPRFTYVLAPGDPEIGAVVRQVVSDDVSAVVIAAGAADSAHFVRELRAAGFSGLILGGHSMGRRQFLAAAGPAAENVLFPLLCEPAAMPASFRLEFEKRYRVSPDYAAASTYDALNLLIAAIRRGGLNRAKIADALVELSPYPGVTGTIAWDKLGSNTRPVVLGTIRAGQVVRFEGTIAGSK